MSSSGQQDSTTLLGEVQYAASLEGEWAPGTSVGRYALLHEVGRGGMGVVLRAYDSRLRREVALKVLHRRTDINARQRIVREA